MANKHISKQSFIKGLHPKHTGIGKKATSFYPGAIHVRFDRKTLPKSGKSIKDGCFIEHKSAYTLVWDLETRALLGMDESKTKEYKRRLNESKYRYSISR